MSASPPPPESLLLDYAAGNAGPATALLLSTHLAMSKESRGLFALMEAAGGALLDELDDEPLERISASSALQRAEASGDVSMPATWPARQAPQSPDPRKGVPSTFIEGELPKPLKSAVHEIGGDRRWRKLGYGVAATRLAASDERERAHLLWARGGTGIATHRHVGREVVLVLQGAFWDSGQRFGPGDVAVCEDGTVHGPSIDRSEDCVCLAVTEAPVHFTGLAGLILNRFCRF
ncbi:MAG: ChrR family anti-sigma-E factor [Pseudomonadota bacterium]